MIKIEKSVYFPPEPSDGKRILVMTLWPRGVSKNKVDVWIKELGTPRDLIKRYKSGKLSWKEYATAYRRSLKGKEELLRSLANESKKGTVTLLCTEKDPGSCHRSLLKEAIETLQQRSPASDLNETQGSSSACISPHPSGPKSIPKPDCQSEILLMSNEMSPVTNKSPEDCL